MCGIFGSLGVSLGDVNLDRVFSSLGRRGPDDKGYSYDESLGVLLGHTRLAIHDLSPLGHQPMESRTGRFEIVFNGEIYNYQEIRDALLTKGYAFRGNSDTEVMLAAFEEWGVQEALCKFVGMFAFALYDKREQKLILARDRMGEKPLYYYKQGGVIAWGSTLSVFNGFTGFTKTLSKSALAKLLRYRYIPGEESVFEEVSKLAPASMMEVDLTAEVRSTEVKKYWDSRDYIGGGKFEYNSDQEVITSFEHLLERAVGRQMQADVPLGAFLSGGVDSSLIVATMQRLSESKVQTYSIGFDVDQYNEAPYARDVAKHLNTEHTEHIVSAKDALEVVPLLASIYDEPFADSSAIPTYLVSKMARKNVTVALSGDGGDELFHGYVGRYSQCDAYFERYANSSFAWAGSLLTKVPLSVRGKVVECLAQYGYQSLSTRKLRALGDLLSSSSKVELHDFSVSCNLDASAYLLSASVEQSRHSGIRVVTGDFPRDYSLIDLHTLLPGDMLCKVDRASMGVSLETRVPLLDRDIVEWGIGLPMRYKLRDGRGKWVLRESLYKSVPQSLIDRPKKGFSVPLEQWLRGELKDWADALLNQSQLINDAIFDQKLVAQAWRQHKLGVNMATVLWPILMVNQWLREHDG